MNWNLCKFLPTAASCQNFFQIIVASHIHSVYIHLVEQLSDGHDGGMTPVKRRGISTQLEVSLIFVCIVNVLNIYSKTIIWLKSLKL